MDRSLEVSHEEIIGIESQDQIITGTPHDRFFSACIDYYREYSSLNSSGGITDAIPDSHVILFLYAEAPRVTVGLPESTLASLDPARRIHRAALDVKSGLVVCNENMGTMIHLKQTFLGVSDAFTFIEENLLKDHVFAIVSMAQKRIIFHHEGMEIDKWISAPKYTKVGLDRNEHITPELISTEIGIFHDEATRTHRCATSQWIWDTSGSKVKLKESPEAQIQSSLVVHLRARFRPFNAHVNEEAHNPGGRTDIRISRFSSGAQRHEVTTMIELKVLFPNKSDKWNLEWAKNGITQAASYRLLNTDACFACVFDARIDKSQSLDCLVPYAELKKVEFRQYSMTPPDKLDTSSKVVAKPRNSARKPRKSSTKARTTRLARRKSPLDD